MGALFKIRGGVHPDDRKHLTKDLAIEKIPMPPVLHLPLQQHIGAHAEPEVERGDKVLKGQVIARAKGMISAPVHAPTSGTILGLHSYHSPTASGLRWQTITMRPDGFDRWIRRAPPLDPLTCRPEEISRRVADCGVVGMGGATFPSAIKLNLGDRHKLEQLVINGSECEPYLTCDDRLMREKAAQVIDGARIMAHSIGVVQVIIAIEDNKPEAIAAMREAAADVPDTSVVTVPSHYPMGAEKQLIQTLTGKETPAGKLTADIGVVVHNAATALAVHDAVRHGKPLIDRVVTVSGGAVARPRNIQAPFGTPIFDLLEFCGGLKEEPEVILVGGPMMGQPIKSVHAPILKGTNGVLALTRAETASRQVMPCIRCAACVSACPMGLLPLDMAARVRKDELDSAVKIGLMDCISCGACSYVCPSNIPLVQYFNFAKGRLKAIDGEQRKQRLTRKLATLRLTRMEEQMRAKKEAFARRKAEQAEKAAQAAAAQPAAQSGAQEAVAQSGGSAETGAAEGGDRQ